MAMLRAISVQAAGTWQSAADTVVLAFDDRHRRRLAMTATRGLEFLLDLPEAVALRGGDALLLDDGKLVEIIAAPEALIEIRCADAFQLARIAWHLGNRHLPTQFIGKALRIRRDHVIEGMLRGLGTRLIEIEAPFDPEGGAYASGGHTEHASATPHSDHSHHRHAPQHAHGSGHDLHADHGHDHAADDHQHHDGCGHDHGHHHHDHGEK
jgi:urease accessory protein